MPVCYTTHAVVSMTTKILVTFVTRRSKIKCETISLNTYVEIDGAKCAVYSYIAIARSACIYVWVYSQWDCGGAVWQLNVISVRLVISLPSSALYMWCTNRCMCVWQQSVMSRCVRGEDPFRSHAHTHRHTQRKYLLSKRFWKLFRSYEMSSDAAVHIQMPPAWSIFIFFEYFCSDILGSCCCNFINRH